MSEQGTASPERDLGWLLDDLAARVDHFRQAVILSRDGLVIAASRDLSREDSEHMAALAAGLQSLAKGAGEHYGVGAVRHGHGAEEVVGAQDPRRQPIDRRPPAGVGGVGQEE